MSGSSSPVRAATRTSGLMISRRDSRKSSSFEPTSLGSPPPHTHHASSVHEPPAAIRATGIIVALVAVLAILAIAFALPAARSKPHGVPIGAAGPQAAIGQVGDILPQHAT